MVAKILRALQIAFFAIVYALILPFNLLFVGLAYVLSPFFALWSMFFGPKLGSFWRLFSTLNASLDGGWAQGVKGFKDPATLGWWALLWQRTRWTWRNPCNGWQSQAYGVRDVTKVFTLKTEIPLPFGYHIKCWLGWNNNKRGGDYFPYMFQFGPRDDD